MVESYLSKDFVVKPQLVLNIVDGLLGLETDLNSVKTNVLCEHCGNYYFSAVRVDSLKWVSQEYKDYKWLQSFVFNKDDKHYYLSVRFYSGDIEGPVFSWNLLVGSFDYEAFSESKVYSHEVLSLCRGNDCLTEGTKLVDKLKIGFSATPKKTFITIKETGEDELLKSLLEKIKSL